MGMYLNPGNSGFETIRNSRYVDKSSLIGLINETIGTTQKLTCISRPRRFGKTFAPKMLCAYYDRTCDSSMLFDDLEIAVNDETNHSYRKHLNQYNVIYLDMTNVMGEAGKEDAVSFIRRRLAQELWAEYPQIKADESLSATLLSAVALTGLELKWNRSAQGAIAQIKEKRYPEALLGFGGDVLLVGIAYGREAKGDKHGHSCVIEKAGK